MLLLITIQKLRIMKFSTKEIFAADMSGILKDVNYWAVRLRIEKVVIDRISTGYKATITY